MVSISELEGKGRVLRWGKAVGCAVVAGDFAANLLLFFELYNRNRSSLSWK